MPTREPYTLEAVSKPMDCSTCCGLRSPSMVAGTATMAVGTSRSAKRSARAAVSEAETGPPARRVRVRAGVRVRARARVRVRVRVRVGGWD